MSSINAAFCPPSTSTSPVPCGPNPQIAIDGRGSSCYTVPFRIPVCPTYDYANSSFNMPNGNNGTALLTTYTTFQALDDNFYLRQLSSALPPAMGLAISALTLCNVLALTPRRKRGSTIHSAVLVGLAAAIATLGCEVYLFSAGAGVSSYLVLTRDWASTRFSGAYRAAVTVRFTGSVVEFAAVQAAFAVQGAALCTWVRVRFGRCWYVGVLVVLVVLGFVAWAFMAAFAGYQIFWVAFMREGTYLPAVYGSSWWVWLDGGYRVSVYLSLGLWCLCCVVGAGMSLWERRAVVLGIGSVGTGGSGGSKGRMAGMIGRKTRARNRYETALRLIGMIAAESFIVPSECCFM